MTCNNINIIKLFDIKKTENNIYLVLEFCNQGDLLEMIKKVKNLEETIALDYFIQMLNAFKTLLAENILHRDFKLANVMLHNGIIKLGDFGFSKIIQEE